MLVWHHQSVTGEFINFVCNPCNLQLKLRRSKIGTAERENEQTLLFFIPVFCQNMEGYDSNHILSSLDGSFEKANLKGITSNTEKFISFSIDGFRFLDSL